jgi:hypothetical protein
VLTNIKIEHNLWSWERSLNPTSTASRLMFALPHPPPPPLLSPPKFSPNDTHTLPRSPSPQERDVSPIDNTSRNHSNTATSTSTPPLSRGMWAAHSVFARRRNWGGITMRGDPRNGRPSQCVPKMNHDFYRGSFSLFPSTISPIDISGLTVAVETRLHTALRCRN